MKIGIVGGTFDPIHNGHLMLGEYAKQLFELEEIWFMPNGNPPHKSNEKIETQTKHRVEMVQRAIADKNDFKIQLYEVNRKEINYSYLTMEYFCKKYPENQFYFIIGADSLFALERWAEPARLLKTCIILAAYRDDKDTQEMDAQIQYLNQKYGADIRLLNTPNVDISSSEIRNMIKNGTSIDSLVPEEVCTYIKEHYLYQMDIERIKDILHGQQGEVRFAHTMGVVDTAISLAKQYGIDEEKARLAALLHDVAKPLSKEEKIRICHENHLFITEAEQANPSLLHAKLGAYIARETYQIFDEDVLNAICYHTTGRPGMTLLEKIVYVADYIEPNRNQAPNLKEIRKLAYVDLDECLYQILENTLVHLQTRSEAIDPMTEQTYLFYKEVLKK